MKLGDGVEFALHCTSALAGLAPNEVMATSALAEFHGASPTYLAKHLKALVKAGILQSVPGPTGGYRLARAPETITLLDVVLAVDGAEPAFRCKDIRKNGPCPLPQSAFPKPCNIKLAMLKAEQVYRAALADTSVADLTQEFVETADARAVSRASEFVAGNARRQPT